MLCRCINVHSSLVELGFLTFSEVSSETGWRADSWTPSWELLQTEMLSAAGKTLTTTRYFTEIQTGPLKKVQTSQGHQSNTDRNIKDAFICWLEEGSDTWRRSDQLRATCWLPPHGSYPLAPPAQSLKNVRWPGRRAEQSPSRRALERARGWGSDSVWALGGVRAHWAGQGLVLMEAPCLWWQTNVKNLCKWVSDQPSQQEGAEGSSDRVSVVLQDNGPSSPKPEPTERQANWFPLKLAYSQHDDYNSLNFIILSVSLKSEQSGSVQVQTAATDAWTVWRFTTWGSEKSH